MVKHHPEYRDAEKAQSRRWKNFNQLIVRFIKDKQTCLTECFKGTVQVDTPSRIPRVFLKKNKPA
jgi:hypothetical protein